MSLAPKKFLHLPRLFINIIACAANLVRRITARLAGISEDGVRPILGTPERQEVHPVRHREFPRDGIRDIAWQAGRLRFDADERQALEVRGQQEGVHGLHEVGNVAAKSEEPDVFRKAEPFRLFMRRVEERRIPDGIADEQQDGIGVLRVHGGKDVEQEIMV